MKKKMYKCLFLEFSSGWKGEKKKLCKAETGLEELVSRHPFGVATWLRLELKGPRSQHEIHVVTLGKRFEVAT